MLVLGFGLALRNINGGLGLGFGLGTQNLGLGATRGLGLGLVIKDLALTLRPRPGQIPCRCFIITRINADEFDPDLFPLCKLNELITAETSPGKCFLCSSILGFIKTNSNVH